MKALRRAAARFREAGSVPVLAVLLMLAALPAAAGERGRPANDSSDTGRHAEPRSDSGRSSPPPSYSPPPSSGSSGGGSSSGGWTSSGGSEPRTARPRGDHGDDAASRQRPRTDSRDRRGGEGWYGGGYYGGYHGYYPRSYFYWGPYWGWGLGWWWDDYYTYGYGYPPYRYPYPYRDRYYDRYGTMGALDTDVSPGKTEIWLDGRYVGTADDFDGFPQYLWLDKGVYDLVLFRDGYRTIARQITIRPGAVISVDDRMERGESTRPEDLATKTHERRDERIRSEEERREEIARRDEDRMDDWRERARRRLEERDRYDRGEDRDDDGRSEAPDGSGRLHLEVLPADASVYLDGRFVGTGIDLERLRQGLRVEPGEHRIAVVRPGHKAEEKELIVAAGEDVELEIELESME